MSDTPPKYLIGEGSISFNVRSHDGRPKMAPNWSPSLDGRDAAMADEFHFAKHLQHYVFCDCDPNPPIGDLTVVEGLVRHMEGCGFAIRCDVCRFAEGVERPASIIHIDYVVCDAHLSTAVDNVATRET